MAVYGSDDFGFLTIGQYNLTSVTTKLEDTIEKPAIESTPYGVTAPAYLPAILTRYSLGSTDVWYDDATDSENALLVDMASGQSVMIMSPHGNSAPATGVGLRCVATDGVEKTMYKRSGDIGDYRKANFEVAVSGIVDQRAMLVAQLVSRGVTGTTAATYNNWGADGAAGGRVYLVVTTVAWDSRTSLQITLQDCNTSDGAYGDHTAFTAIIPATTPEGTGTSEMKVLAADAIEQFTSVTWTWAGGAAGAEAATLAVVVAYD